MRKLRHEEIPRPDPQRLAALPKHPIRVIANNIRSIHNVGSIFRTSDAARIEHLHLTGFSGTPENRALHKSALGAQDVVPWSYSRSAVDVISGLRTLEYRIAVLEITDSPTAVADLQTHDFPLALVLGNEVEGVDHQVIELADLAIEIPQYGIKQSLNVSVAYGVAIFDLVRRFRVMNELPLRETGAR